MDRAGHSDLCRAAAGDRVGALVGLFNGALVTGLRIPSFIVTLGSYNLIYGVSLWITKTSTFNPVYPPPGVEIPPAELDFFTGLTASFGTHPISLEVVWMLGLALVVGFLLHRTLFGFRLMAIGGNPVAAQLARLPVTRYKILAFVICGMLAAIAGILDFSFIQTAQPNIGLSFTFPVFAAVIIGGASLSGGKGTVIGAMSGALLLAELQQGLALLSPGPHVQQLFLGFVTIGAVALDLAAHQHPQAQGGMNGGAASVSAACTKRYGATVALAGVDLDLRPGEVLGIAGPNGAGKSTLVRIIAGEERADGGELTLRRPALVADRRLARRRRRPSGAAALPQSHRRRECARRARRRQRWPPEARRRRCEDHAGASASTASPTASRRLHARDPATHGDRARGGARRAGVPVRRTEFRADRRGIRTNCSERSTSLQRTAGSCFS